MRQRQDFYTLCPGCETKIELTLAAKLQSARSGCSCVCQSCKHEWVCIQEWVYRHESIDHSQPIATPQQVPTGYPQQTGGYQQTPPPTVVAVQPPRPHLPTFQPPRPIAPAAQPQPVAMSGGDAYIAQDQASVNPVPAPHAWSWERKTQQQPTQPQDFQTGYGH
jgi:hypothetical protein